MYLPSPILFSFSCILQRNRTRWLVKRLRLLFDLCTIVILCYVCSFSKSKARKLEKNEETCGSEPPAKVSAIYNLLVSQQYIILIRPGSLWVLSKEVSKGNLASPTSCRIDQPKDIILVCCGNCLFQDRSASCLPHGRAVTPVTVCLTLKTSSPYVGISTCCVGIYIGVPNQNGMCMCMHGIHAGQIGWVLIVNINIACLCWVAKVRLCR